MKSVFNKSPASLFAAQDVRRFPFTFFSQSTNHGIGLGDAPLSILRPTLLHLRDPARLARIAGNILELLKGPQPHEDSATLELHQWSGELTPEFREQFQRSLRTHLFGRSNLLSQRLRIALASYCQVCSYYRQTALLSSIEGLYRNNARHPRCAMRSAMLQ